jgi:hypothetical protein
MANEHEDITQAQRGPSPDGEALHALAIRLLDYADTENLNGSSDNFAYAQCRRGGF